jgi:hypothetical protein
MSRWKAGAIHFSISSMVCLGLLGVILSLWYPGILFIIERGWTGLRILIGVDLVLGPLLTLIVFKAGKPGLRFDLSCIVTAQALCMAAGMWLVYNERPLVVVLAYDTFFSLTADEFADYDRDVSILDTLPGRYPKFVYVELPDNDISADIVAARSQYIGDPLFIQAEKYRVIPDQPEALDAVFRREAAVRELFASEHDEMPAARCLLSQFVSVVTTGYVCFDRVDHKLSAFYEFGKTRS